MKSSRVFRGVRVFSFSLFGCTLCLFSVGAAHLGLNGVVLFQRKAERDPRITGQIMFSICCFQDNETEMFCRFSLSVVLETTDRKHDLPGDSWVPLRFFSGKEQTPLSPRCAATTEKRQSVQPKSEKKKTRTPQKTRGAYK